MPVYSPKTGFHLAGSCSSPTAALLRHKTRNVQRGAACGACCCALAPQAGRGRNNDRLMFVTQLRLVYPQGRHHCTLPRLADSILGVLFMVCGITFHADKPCERAV